MGTRHIIAVQSKGEYKIAQYGQWDGYPDGQGVTVLSFLQDEKQVKKLKKNLAKTRFIDNEKDKDFLEAYEKNAPEWSNQPDNRTPEQIHWFNTYMTRDLGAKILTSVANSKDKEILLRNELPFVADSLFCEWAYVIDFDAGTFEVYRGFQKSPPPKGERFADIKSEEKGSEYFPVALAKKYKLSKLPSKEKFLKDLKEKNE